MAPVVSNGTSNGKDSISSAIDIDDKYTQDLVIGFEPEYRHGPSKDKDTTSQAAEATVEEEDDPWKSADLQEFGKPWAELTSKEKRNRVLIGVGKAIAVLCLLYFFVCSLDLLSLSFRLVGGKATGDIFQQSEILSNPIVGVMIGVLTTVLVQSSSTSTSIIVSMVSASIIEVRIAIPIIMGANIGTSITNTIVSLTQAGDRNQFRRAFAGATVHDMFNWLTVIVMLILELTTGYLYRLTTAIMDGLVSENSTSGGEVEILTVITKPTVNLIAQLDSSVLECYSLPNCTTNNTLLKRDCSAKDSDVFQQCKSLFAQFDNLGDAAAGGILLACALLVLCSCLILIVKVLQSVLKGQIANVIKKTLNSKIPYVPWLTGYIALGVGAIMTFLVQSSSVFTSALTPLVGLGVISVERTYPLTLGSNIGTTTTALLASMAVEGSSFRPSMQIALCHLFFNVTGILLFYPIPFMRFPIRMAKFLGDTTAKYRWFAILYMIMMFVGLPAICMGLSFAGAPYVIAFAVILVTTILFVVIVNNLRAWKPNLLPKFLLSWKWLPQPLRSLEPYDRVFSSWSCCRKLKEKNLDSPTTARANVNSNANGNANDNTGFEMEPEEGTKDQKHINMVYIGSEDDNNKRNSNNNNGNVNRGYVE